MLASSARVWSRAMVEFPLLAMERESLVEVFRPAFTEARPWNPDYIRTGRAVTLRKNAYCTLN